MFFSPVQDLWGHFMCHSEASPPFASYWISSSVHTDFDNEESVGHGLPAATPSNIYQCWLNSRQLSIGRVSNLYPALSVDVLQLPTPWIIALESASKNNKWPSSPPSVCVCASDQIVSYSLQKYTLRFLFFTSSRKYNKNIFVIKHKDSIHILH